MRKSAIFTVIFLTICGWVGYLTLIFVSCSGSIDTTVVFRCKYSRKISVVYPSSRFCNTTECVECSRSIVCTRSEYGCNTAKVSKRSILTKLCRSLSICKSTISKLSTRTNPRRKSNNMCCTTNGIGSLSRSDD